MAAPPRQALPRTSASIGLAHRHRAPRHRLITRNGLSSDGRNPQWRSRPVAEVVRSVLRVARRVPRASAGTACGRLPFEQYRPVAWASGAAVASSSRRQPATPALWLPPAEQRQVPAHLPHKRRPLRIDDDSIFSPLPAIGIGWTVARHGILLRSHTLN